MPFAAAFLLAALLLAGCGAGPSDFAAGIARIDRLLATGSPAPRDLASAQGRLYGLARSAADWLALAKRARAAEASGDGGRGIATADRMLKALPFSEPVAEAAAWLYLRGGKPAKALSLFPKPLDPEVFPALWAEAFLAVQATAVKVPALDQTICARLAKATGDPSWYEEAAILAMQASDRFAASAWIAAGLAAGGRPPPELLWDAGMARELLTGLGDQPPAEYLALGGDAAWTLGDRRLAASLWKQALKSGTGEPWRLRVDNAILEAPGDAALAAARSIVVADAARPEALRFAAAIMLRDGDSASAYAIGARLAKGLDPQAPGANGKNAPATPTPPSEAMALFLALELQAGKGAEDRLVASAFRLAERFPEVMELRSGLMRLLLQRARYEEFVAFFDEGQRRPIPAADSWFYRMATLVLRGDFEMARALAEEGAASAPGPGPGRSWGAFALALLEDRGGNHDGALDTYLAALGLSIQVRERSTILKEIGRVEMARGDAASAGRAWQAAAEADPSDSEALILAANRR